MKKVSSALLVLLCALPARADADPAPRPLGLSLGTSLTKTLSTLKTLNVGVTTNEKKQPGIHGSPYTYTRVSATLPKGKIEQVKLYFYEQKLARMKLLARDGSAPLSVNSLGKPSLSSPSGRHFWWRAKELSGVSCQEHQKENFSSPTGSSPKGECEIFDMRVLVGVLGNRQQIEVQFQLLVQGTAEKLRKQRTQRP